MQISTQKKRGSMPTPSPLLKNIAIVALAVLIACPWKEAFGLSAGPRLGVRAIYQAEQTEERSADFDLLLSNTVAVLQDRLINRGFFQAAVTRDGTDRIRVIIPDIQTDNEILDILCIPARLEFKDEAGNVLIEDKDIKLAHAYYDYGAYMVYIELTPEGAELFALATAANLGRVITIEVDGEIISAPVVNSVITGGSAIIESPGMTAEEATRLAMLIHSDGMPLRIERIETTFIAITPGMIMPNPGRTLAQTNALYQWLPVAMQLLLRLLWP